MRIIILSILVILTSCTVTKRIHQLGLHVEWHNHLNKGISNDDGSRAENNSLEIKERDETSISDFSKELIKAETKRDDCANHKSKSEIVSTQRDTKGNRTMSEDNGVKTDWHSNSATNSLNEKNGTPLFMRALVNDKIGHLKNSKMSDQQAKELTEEAKRKKITKFLWTVFLFMLLIGAALLADNPAGGILMFVLAFFR